MVFNLTLVGFAKTQQDVTQFTLRLEKLGLFDQVDLLQSAREPIGKPRGQPFDPRSWAPPAPAARAIAATPPKPVAPPVPYRVAGQVSHDGVMEVVCGAGNGLPGSPFRVISGKNPRPVADVPAFPDFAGGCFVACR